MRQPNAWAMLKSKFSIVAINGMVDDHRAAQCGYGSSVNILPFGGKLELGD